MKNNTDFIHGALRNGGVLVILLLCMIGPHVAFAQQESGLVTGGTLPAGAERLFAYEPWQGKYPNIFKEQGRMYATILVAESRNGKYVDDKFAIYDITNLTPGAATGRLFSITPGEVHYDLKGVPITIAFENRDNVLWLNISLPRSSQITSVYESPVKALYRWRLRTAARGSWCGHQYLTGYQAGATGDYLFFDGTLSSYLDREPPDNFRLLAPLYIVPIVDGGGHLLGRTIPIADTGCSIYYHQSDNTFQDKP